MAQSPSWLQLTISSLLLPAIVALLVSWYDAKRRDNRDLNGWFDNIVAAANGIERAWYNTDELTNQKQDSTIETVDEYVERLTEEKNDPTAPTKLTEAIERLDRRWMLSKTILPAHQKSLYQSHGDSIKRNARQIKYIAELNRPKSLKDRVTRYFPHPIQRVKHLRELGFERERIRRFTPENIAVLKDYFSTEDINRIEKGELSIRVTSPFDSRFCVSFSDDSDARFLAVEGFSRAVRDNPNMTIRNSFRVYPISEDQLIHELKHAQDWNLEDTETTKELAFQNLETS